MQLQYESSTYNPPCYIHINPIFISYIYIYMYVVFLFGGNGGLQLWKVNGS